MKLRKRITLGSLGAIGILVASKLGVEPDAVELAAYVLLATIGGQSASDMVLAYKGTKKE